MITPTAPMNLKTRTHAQAFAALATGAVTLLAPALAVACPSARAAACGGCGGHSSLAGYLVAVGIGLLAGATSVGLQGRLRGRHHDGDR